MAALLGRPLERSEVESELLRAYADVFACELVEVERSALAACIAVWSESLRFKSCDKQARAQQSNRADHPKKQKTRSFILWPIGSPRSPQTARKSPSRWRTQRPRPAHHPLYRRRRHGAGYLGGAVRVFDAAIEKAYGGQRRIAWMEVLGRREGI